MKILLDENLPHALRLRLPGEVFTTAFKGWSGLKNGELLGRAVSDGFTTLVTMDNGIEFEQSVRRLKMSVVVLHAKTNKLEDIEPYLILLVAVLNQVQAGNVYHVTG